MVSPATTDPRTYATGKRKTAIARVWIKPGTGNFVVNGHALDVYFDRATSVMIANQALELVEVKGQFDIVATCTGGGKSAQAEAVRHGISRALCDVDAEKRPALKRAGFLTRDARKKERKKYGQPGARKRFQYSKR